MKNLTFIKQPREHKSKPRCHYTGKKGNWKPKTAYENEVMASSYMKRHGLSGYVVYKCEVCNKYHIGKYEDKDRII